MPKIIDIERWRNEISLAEEFRKKEFGEYEEQKISKAGENIEFFERGFANKLFIGDEEITTTLNIIHAITKNIVPSLYFKNPKVLVLPTRSDSQDTAPIVQDIINYYYRRLDIDEINQRIIWDAYVLGHGYYKVGYATKFGMDIKEEEKKLSAIDKGLITLGLKKPSKENEKTMPEVNQNIESESPYISYVSPFDFLKDPRALNLEESMWIGQRFKRTVAQMKSNKKYKNTSKLKGIEPNIPQSSFVKMSQTQIEEFKILYLYEIHYRTEDGVYLLVISKDQDEFNEHYHEKTIYKIDGWQFGELTFNKHGHKAFAVSDITKIKNLQDRFTITIDNILEQVDKFVPKIAVNENDVTPDGMNNLENGGIGAIVRTTKDPNMVFKELNFTQVKGDLKILADQIIDIVTIQTGLTRAQLTGVSSSQTATEATIEQGGQTLRLSDMNSAVNKMTKKQAIKLWQVIRFFVDLEELELINGVSGIDERGFPIYNWVTTGINNSEKMQTGDYEFDIEIGSSQKPDLAIIRKQFENLFSILARTDVITLMQQQGKKVDLAELLKMYLRLFPEITKDVGKVIQNITPQTRGLLIL